MKLDSTDAFSIASEQNSSERKAVRPEVSSCNDWCYVYVHHAKLPAVMERFAKDAVFHVFAHKAVNGMLFIQGKVRAVKKYLQDNFQSLCLVNDCGTGREAVIRDSVMKAFMKVLEIDPDRVRFMLKPISEYAEGNPLLRITSGVFEGLEGYVIRIDRDRKLVMAVGDRTIAISGVNKESFEKVEDYDKMMELLDNH